MPPVAAPVPAPRIHANVRRLMCDAPVERAMLNSLRAQGSVNVTYALDKTKKDFIKAARPLFFFSVFSRFFLSFFVLKKRLKKSGFFFRLLFDVLAKN